MPFLPVELRSISRNSWVFPTNQTPSGGVQRPVLFPGTGGQLPGSVQAIYYILCFCGWTLTFFSVWPGKAEIPKTQSCKPVTPTRLLSVSIKCCSSYMAGLSVNETGLPLADLAKNALRLALDLSSANTTYRQAINHRHKIMRL